jgi:hypothetical protein
MWTRWSMQSLSGMLAIPQPAKKLSEAQYSAQNPPSIGSEVNAYPDNVCLQLSPLRPGFQYSLPESGFRTKMVYTILPSPVVHSHLIHLNRPSAKKSKLWKLSVRLRFFTPSSMYQAFLECFRFLIFSLLRCHLAIPVQPLSAALCRCSLEFFRLAPFQFPPPQFLR